MRSGQITVTTAGTAVQGPDVVGDYFIFAPHPANTGIMYVGDDGSGDVTSTNGFPVEQPVRIYTPGGNLNNLWFDASVSTEKICWIKD